MTDELTEQSIQKRLNHFFASWKYNVDGLFVFSWESDKLLWTKAGYIYEFEIKISRSDFKADFKHKIEKHLILSSALPDETEQPQMPDLFDNYQKQRKKKYGDYITDEDIKREFERMGDVTGKRMPNYFYYAVPEGLIQPDEVPPYAGLLWLTKEYKYGGGIIHKKKAPRLHDTKYTDGELNLGEKFYYNWKSAVRKYNEADKDATDLRQQLKEELESKGQEKTYAQMASELENVTERRDHWQKSAVTSMNDCMAYRQENRRLRHELLKLNPDFDFKAIEDEVERLYGNRTPNDL